MAKVKKSVQKKRSPQSKYQLVRMLRKSKTDTFKTLDSYREKLINEPISSGKVFLTDLTDDPGQTIVSLIKEGHELTVAVRKDTRKTASRWIDTGSGLVRDLAKNPSKVIENAVDDGKAYVSEVRTETRQNIEQARKRGQKVVRAFKEDVSTVTEVTLKRGKDLLHKPVQNLEAQLNRQLKSLPDRLGLPGKQDITRMGKVLKKLDGKIDRLAQSAAA